jgi:hypothetical protein
VSSRKEQKEALRREREKREAEAREAERRRRFVGYGVGGALAVAAVAAIVVVLAAGGGDGGNGGGDLFPEGGKVPEQSGTTTSVTKAARAAGCSLRDFKAKSREHTTDLSKRVRYDSNPPSEGRHYQFPADDGLYGRAPQDEQLVHSQEHGRVVFWVKPSLPKRVRADLRAFFDDDPFQMLMVPRSKMPYAVAATAWGRDPVPLGTGYLVGCPRFGDRVFDALRAFRDEHRGNGPEAVQ